MEFLRYVRRATCICAALVLPGCELTRDPVIVQFTEDHVLVESVLLAGDSTARVLLRVITPTSDPFNPFAQPEWIPVSDADVRLIDGADTIPMNARLDAATNACVFGPVYDATPAGDLLPGCYIGRVPGGILNGRAYELLIDLPGLGRVHGRTVVPQPPAILEPAADAVLPASSSGGLPPAGVAVRWEGAGLDRKAELTVTPADSACTTRLDAGPIGTSSWMNVTGSTTAELLVVAGCDPAQDTIPADIVLTAFDSVYSRYERMNNDRNPHMADAAAGFTGPAIGVFGSAASARQPVRFVPD